MSSEAQEKMSDSASASSSHNQNETPSESHVSNNQQLEQAEAEHKLGKASCTEQIVEFQRKEAHVLELAYAYVADYPNVSEKIRMAAHDARTHQMTACGVMKSVRMTADHIHYIMIPIVLEAIETKDSELIADAIALSLEFITEVRQEVVALKDSFENFREFEKVKEDLKREIQMAKENNRLDKEIFEQHIQNELHKRAMDRLENKMGIMLEEIKRSKEIREQFLYKTCC
ncbi:uncharacterized protein LOC127858586 [Dreissena polymorpha]|uniref:uncharacterized protein LOC127858586 n=1 Tax=Dreissena polymorpha TaxID=45954 RepID=UPI002264E8F1|nr:uncharacterized protein LOC127858586 [Dreissena polymorpha]